MDRIFEKIVVDYPPEDLCTYPEYRGKPYFSIQYEENGEHFVGFGTYKPEVFSHYLSEYFINKATPEQKKCKNCKWWSSDNDGFGYCQACKHGHYSDSWDISIYRKTKADFYCADYVDRRKEPIDG